MTSRIRRWPISNRSSHGAVAVKVLCHSVTARSASWSAAASTKSENSACARRLDVVTVGSPLASAVTVGSISTRTQCRISAITVSAGFLTAEVIGGEAYDHHVFLKFLKKFLQLPVLWSESTFRGDIYHYDLLALKSGEVYFSSIDLLYLKLMYGWLHH